MRHNNAKQHYFLTSVPRMKAPDMSVVPLKKITKFKAAYAIFEQKQQLLEHKTMDLKINEVVLQELFIFNFIYLAFIFITNFIIYISSEWVSGKKLNNARRKTPDFS